MLFFRYFGSQNFPSTAPQRTSAAPLAGLDEFKFNQPAVNICQLYARSDGTLYNTENHRCLPEAFICLLKFCVVLTLFWHVLASKAEVWTFPDMSELVEASGIAESVLP
ncbi:hypothetical protein T4B_4198 [Trichinella pseudospiralis]|uniref:Uncharacterized protein n=1 Tax=Trichinella pseudospiralis TaxID=6337 RepID=A0A0V1I537_TRIPS|nr:hypothetical protein T4A_10483 [Trichinella pseudospiralis]KRZ17965.1 hypothetical protein T4B_4198 [Trichinella pseudospiralis]